MTKFTETVAAADIRSAVWLEALGRHHGNISRTSKEFGFSKQRGSALTRRHGLVDEAKNMRVNAGQPATGRPKHSPDPIKGGEKVNK